MGTSVLVAVFLVTVLSCCTQLVTSCSCLLAHPQEYVCNSDFVILAQVRKETFHREDHLIKYKVKIRKEFKASQEASMVLRSRTLVTAISDGLCGIRLSVGTKYLLAGRIYSGQARLSLCSLNKRWDQVSSKQKKGVRLLYHQGCQCKISDCPWWRKCSDSQFACKWETSRFGPEDCQSIHGVCLPHPSGGCEWLATRSYRECVKQKKRERESNLAREP